MNVLIITPPLVQTNTPYPSGAYLKSYFTYNGDSSHWDDLSLELFYSIFSRDGLKKLFELSQNNAIRLANNAEKNGDDNTAFNLRRYVNFKDKWINWIDTITAILCGKAREKEHQFLYSPFAPRGNRMENFLASLQNEPTVDDVRFLCSYAIADLADYITAVFDSEFSLIRYAEHLTVDERDFASIEKGLESPVLKHFYEPVLQKFYNDNSTENKNAPDMVCISVPFAGTFLPALYTARYFKQKYGEKTFVVIGGGFVNTELRNAREIELAKYVDGISYDRGYGSYKKLAEMKKNNQLSSIYKMRLFKNGKCIEPLWEDNQTQEYEEEITAKIIPDYSDIDFSRYPRMCDDKNAMHRIWTDGTWIKAYLAHGCYWHKCAFCDTKLDYVCGYKQVEVENLYNGLLKTAVDKNIYGIHFVDEALPPVALKQFALLNARHGNQLYFWGNVRFEKTFTKDFAAFLSYCGLGAVSAGIEVATGTGLKNINKGTDIDSIVSACAAFKEAGILVHAYMIYGFWYDNAQTIIDSMETLRQFYECGLLDSAFWHKFVLTRNSTVYSQWQEGKMPELKPIENPQKKMFANNNLHFEREGDFDKFGLPLETALDNWMHGQKLETKVQKWFDFAVPSPTIQRNFIESSIEKYEQKNQKHNHQLAKDKVDNLFWLGNDVASDGKEYHWIYLQEEFAQAINFDVDLLLKLRPEISEKERMTAIDIIKNNKKILTDMEKLLGLGLVLLDF